MNSRIMPAELASFSRSQRSAPLAAAEDADAVDLRGLLRAIWRGKWLVAGAMLLCGLAAWFAASQVPPVYTATAKVMLDPRKAQIITGEELVQDLDLSEQIVNGEAALLRSNVLIEQVVASIGPARVDAKGIMGVTPDLALALTASVESPETRSPEIDRIMQGLVWLIRRDLQVYTENDSYVIGLRMEHEDPVLAAEIANSLARTYIATQIDVRRETATGATIWLGERVDELRAQLEQAEAAVAEARAAGLVADGGTADTATQQLADLNGQLVEARSDRVAAEARLNQLQTMLGTGSLEDVADLVTSPLIEQLNLERIELAREDAQWAQRYDETHPERQRILGEQERLRADLREEVDRIVAQRRNEAEVARLREDSLRSGIADLESRIVAITRNAQGLRQMEREAQAKRQTYEALLSRLTETRTQEQLQQPDARLIERASIPAAPSAPRPKLMAALGAMIGGALGLGLVFFFEMTAQTFRGSRELEAATGLPLLAAIPVQNWRDPMAATRALQKDPYSPYGERIRHLRTALLMRDGQDTSRSVLLMSAAPGEGKTTTTLALAQMSVLAGKSVIVVDADLRRSTMQAAFGWDMDEDFADFIRGDCALDRAIYTDPEFGFDFLAARGPQPDVADKLSVTWLRTVVDELKRVYDVVLIDAPALLAVSDALVLAQVSDIRVFLARWDHTPRRAVAEGLSQVEEMGLDVAGTVLTMVDPDRSPDAQAGSYSYDA